MRYRYCTDKKSSCMLQIWGQPARLVLAAENGEGDLTGLGKVGNPTQFGPWLRRALPKWAARVSGDTKGGSK